jgi:DNA polymerase-1
VNGLEAFDEIWACDTEYSATSGHRPTPICLVARELRTGRQLRLWADQLAQLSAPPFRTDSKSLFVAYAAAAEFSVFHVLGWPAPARTLDLFFEFRALTNKLETPSGCGLLGALVYHGLPAMAGAEKEEMRNLAIRGGPFSAEEKAALLNYCEEDVAALAKLLPAMLPAIDVPRAIFRGRFAWAAAAMEHNGIPLDVPAFERLRQQWPTIQERIVADVNGRYWVYDGTTFKEEKFARYLIEQGIPWPRTETGRLDLKDDTFRSQAKAHPAIAELREARASLGQMRLFENLSIGPDGRNRTALMPFCSSTGRNQPSNARFIFGTSRWLRSLIRPPRGRAIAYIDFEQQEFGIAASLSGDTAMQEAYRSGDPYLAFGKQAGAIPADGTKATHAAARALFKQCVLAVQYGMGPERLAINIGRPPVEAQRLLNLHKSTYPRYWEWSQAAVDRAMLTGELHTVFGWRTRVGASRDASRPAVNPRSLANFPCQANGAEMLRLACCMLVESGILVCAPIHDAVLIEAGVDEVDEVVARARAIMAEASRVVLDGFEIGTDAKIVRWPDRYVDEAGGEFWDTVWRHAGLSPDDIGADDTQPPRAC